MTRQVTLQELLLEYRSAARITTAPSQNTSIRDSQVIKLQQTQRFLWGDYPWPHLRVTRRIELAAGQQYCDPPSDVRLDRIEEVRYRYCNEWIKLAPGIREQDYAVYDSDLDQRATPVERWDIYEGSQIEVWPLPASATDTDTLEGYLEITGIRSLNPLVDDSDTTDLDADLIVMFAAAEKLASDKSADAKSVAQLAQQIYTRLRGRQEIVSRHRGMFQNNRLGRRPRGMPSVYYRKDTES